MVTRGGYVKSNQVLLLVAREVVSHFINLVLRSTLHIFFFKNHSLLNPQALCELGVVSALLPLCHHAVYEEQQANPNTKFKTPSIRSVSSVLLL